MKKTFKRWKFLRVINKVVKEYGAVVKVYSEEEKGIWLQVQIKDIYSHQLIKSYDNPKEIAKIILNEVKLKISREQKKLN
jgi:hypothetical protein